MTCYRVDLSTSNILTVQYRIMRIRFSIRDLPDDSSQTVSFLTGAIRGAKFGGLIGLAIGLVINLGGLLVIVVSVPLDVRQVIGLIAALGGNIALMTLCSALTGAFLIGVLRVLRRKPD